VTTILVIDDHPSARAGLVAALSGYDVTEAATVGEAMEALAAEPFAAAVVDLGMDRPSVALHGLLQRLRVPVVVVSGLEEEDARAAASSNGWRCLSKPFTAEALRAVVEELVGDRPGAPRATRPEILPPPSPTERPPVPERTDSGAPAGPHDPWRDRIRVVMDRLLYLAGLAALVHLARAGKLDVGTTAAVLLVTGVRPHNLFEAAQAARGAGAGGVRAGGFALLFAPMIEAARSGTWLGR
jgi:CheY-like chemotaxis protein